METSTSTGTAHHNEVFTGRTVTLPEGRISFTAKEARFFSQLFTIVDSDGDGQLQARQATSFIRRSKLPDLVLKEAWRWACGGSSRQVISVDEWFVLLKLVALGQKDGEPASSLDPLFQGVSLPTPNFHFVVERPDMSVSIGEDYPEDVCAVDVCDPVIKGSVFSKFVEYTVKVSTSLSHFHNHTMASTRRYSDFAWLHGRLKQSYPATAIPPMPGKRLLRNLEPGFIEERRVSLIQFLSHVVRHPKLSHAFDVQVFCDSNERGFETYKLITDELFAVLVSRGSGSPKTVAETIKSMNLFMDRSSMEFLNSELLLDPEDVHDDQLDSDALMVKKYRRTLRVYHVGLTEVVKAVDKFVNFRRVQSYEVARLAAYMVNLSRVESTHLKRCQSIALPHANDLLDDVMEANQPDGVDEDVLEQFAFLERTGSQLDIVSNRQHDTTDELTANVLGPLKYMLGLVVSMTKVLKVYDEEVASLRSLQTKYSNRKREYDSLRASGSRVDHAKVEVANAKVDRTKQEMATRRDSIKELGTSIESEMKKFEHERLQQLRTVMTECAALQLKASTHQIQLLQSMVGQPTMPEPFTSGLGDIHVEASKEFYTRRATVQQSMSGRFKSAMNGKPLMPSFTK